MIAMAAVVVGGVSGGRKLANKQNGVSIHRKLTNKVREKHMHQAN